MAVLEETNAKLEAQSKPAAGGAKQAVLPSTTSQDLPQQVTPWNVLVKSETS